MSYKLYNDETVWHKEYNANESLKNIMADNGLKGRARLIYWEYETKGYRVDKSSFYFEIKEVVN